MKFYLAGASAEVARVEMYRNAVLALGHTITFDWTVPVRQHGGNLPHLTRDEKKAFALDDLKAAIAASIFWFLVPQPPKHTEGGWAELGAVATSIGGTIITSGPSRSIFATLAHYNFDTDDQALEWVRHSVPRALGL